MTTNQIKVTVDKEKNTLTITLPIEKKLSKSRASYVIATSGMFRESGVFFDGEEMRISATAIIRNECYDDLGEVVRQANYLSGREKEEQA